jgi:hypothetical protein
MLPILSSPLAACFDDLRPEACDEVSLLDTQESAYAWNMWGGGTARNLYELPPVHWVHAMTWTSIGDWMTPYNTQAAPGFIDAIQAASGWNAEQPLFFVRDRKNIMTLPWGAFSKCWRALLCAFDDGPLLVPAQIGAASVVCFAVLGHVQHAVRTIE